MKVGFMELIHNDKTIILQNNNLKLTLDSAGKAIELLFQGTNLLNNLSGNIIDPDRHHSFYLDYHQNLKSKTPHYTSIKILENNDQCKHIVFIDDRSPLALEYHLLMRGEGSYLYSYVVASSNVNYPFTINELRTVYRLDRKLFPNSYTCARIGYQPTSDYTNKFTKLQDETYKLPYGERFTNSKIYSKYDYADYLSDNSFWGFYGQDYGFWFIPVSKDYYPTGPLKQELMVHYDGIILNYLQGAHFGTGDFTIKPQWKKFYGPWCLYLNTGDNKINDAKNFARSEEQKWPYQWVNNSLYTVKRSQVRGKIKLSNNQPCKLKVILSQGEESFDKASAGYIYYCDSDAEGNFQIKNVRLGKYKLQAYPLEGSVTGTFCKAVDISQEQEDLSEITWQLPQEEVFWQLGTSTHTTYPFKFSDQLRNTIWRSLVPQNLYFKNGISKDQSDWYCLQGDQGSWNIQFSGVFPQKGGFLVLKIALAGASKEDANHENDRGRGDPWLGVWLNGHQLGQKQFIDDNAVYRNALKSGSYHSWDLTVPLDFMKENDNILSFKVKDGYVMYDTILLVERRFDE